MNTPGKRPERVLIARGAFADIYEPAWHRALADLGVASEVFDAHALTLPFILGRIERRVLWGPGVSRVRKELLEKVRSFRPDVALLYQGHYYDASSIQALRRNTFVVGYHNDDPFGPRRHMLRYRHLRDALPHYDGFHVYRRINIPEALEAGAKRVGILRSYFIPWLDYPRDLTREQAREHSCDVLFAGHAEPDLRVDCLSSAVSAGFQVRICGEGQYWKEALTRDVHSRLPQIRKVVGDGYRLALCGAKIATCFFSKWNRDQYTRRVFEIPACGAFMLSERTPEMLEMFNEDVEAVYFSSPEEFTDKIRFYLGNDAARVRIGRAGAEKVRLAGHDIHSRLRQWLDDVSRWMGEDGRA